MHANSQANTSRCATCRWPCTDECCFTGAVEIYTPTDLRPHSLLDERPRSLARPQPCSTSVVSSFSLVHRQSFARQRFSSSYVSRCNSNSLDTPHHTTPATIHLSSSRPPLPPFQWSLFSCFRVQLTRHSVVLPQMPVFRSRVPFHLSYTFRSRCTVHLNCQTLI